MLSQEHAAAPRGRLGAAAILVLLLAAPAASAAALDELMAALAARGAVVARFEEERHVSFLDRTLVSWGTLSFTPPDELIKQTLAPEASLARVAGDRLLLVDGSGAERRLSLDDDPTLRAYLAPFRALLAGDRAVLERHYEVAADFRPDAWSLRLRPREPEVARRIEHILVEGRDDRVERIEIQERGGDRTSLRLSEAGR